MERSDVKTIKGVISHSRISFSSSCFDRHYYSSLVPADSLTALDMLGLTKVLVPPLVLIG